MSDLIPFQSTADIEKLSEEDLKRYGLTEGGIDALKNYAFERKFWKGIENAPTDYTVTEEREGWKDKQGQPVMVEYVPEEYCLSELNRLFPGWWVEDMKRSPAEEVMKLRVAMVDGYLMIPYINREGRGVRKIWAIAGSELKFRQGTMEPVDLPNEFKGARTEWLRIACKWLGIGLDIYHQHITPAMRRIFEDLIRDWSSYATYWINLAKSTTTGKGFRDMLKAMPRKEQVELALKCIPVFPPEHQAPLWKQFAGHANAPSDRKQKFEEFLNKLEQGARNIKQKEATNG